MPGQAARGSGALAAFVDIVVEMTWYDRRSDGDRCGRLRAFSHHLETPRHMVIALKVCLKSPSTP